MSLKEKSNNIFFLRNIKYNGSLKSQSERRKRIFLVNYYQKAHFKSKIKDGKDHKRVQV